MYSIKDFEAIINFLNQYDINYESGNYYNENGAIVGHWIKIDSDIETNELTQEDIKYNS